MATTVLSGRATIERPLTITLAIAVVVLNAIGSVVTLPWVPDEAPTEVIVVSTIISLALVGVSYWLWQARRWAWWAVFVVMLISGLLALPGLGVAPVLAGIGVGLSVIVCGLLLTPSARHFVH